MKEKVLVIIPTYNEKENIRRIIPAIHKNLPDADILVVDDHSPDGTARTVTDFNDPKVFLLERKGKLGLGTAYIAGFNWALDKSYEYMFEMDADFSHDPEDLPRLLETCKNGADVAIGSRYISGVNVVNWPLGRIMISVGASMYVRMITGLPVKDATAGFKCYRRTVLETISLDKIRSIGYAFQIEMKFLAWKHGFILREIPIIFKDRTVGSSKMSGGIFGEAVWGVIRMKWNSLFRKFEKANRKGQTEK
ncbi:MAG: polyprenol monophosphomannose synthase [Chlorobi bacterium]|nr:polyprenol monophosphomannose synthase [Chlorobiota bacterium]